MRQLERNCPVCHERNHDLIRIEQDRWQLVRCCVCQFVFLFNPPDCDALKEEFAWEHTYAAETERRKQNRLLPAWMHGVSRAGLRLMKGKPRSREIGIIDRYFEAGPVLDVGCGSGKLLRWMPARFIPFGIDVSAQLAKQCDPVCRECGGHVVHADAIGGMKTFEDQFFSGVIMRAFLEHEINPSGALAEARRLLRPGGALMIQVPNYGCINRRITGRRWCGYRYPDHVNYFTPESLSRLVCQAGFDIERFGFFDRFWFSDVMWMIARIPFRAATTSTQSLQKTGTLLRGFRKRAVAFGVELDKARYRLRLARYHGLAEQIADYLKTKSSDESVVLVDVGVGNGRTLRYLEPTGVSERIRFIGLDNSSKRLREMYKPDRWELIQSDVRLPIPLADGLADIAVCEQVIEHLNHPDSLLAEIQRILKPGGILIAGVPTFIPGMAWIRESVVPLVDRWRGKNRGHVQVFTCKSFIKLIDASPNLNVVNIRGYRIISDIPLLGLEDQRWWWRFNRWLGQRLPMLCIETQVRARKRLLWLLVMTGIHTEACFATMEE